MNTTSSDNIQLLIASATFLAVLVALFAERFWKWLDRPRIKVYFSDQDSECYHKTTMDIHYRNGQTIESISIPTYYVRLKVFNSGRETLNNVEVVLEKIEPRPTTFMSLNLSWAGFINPPNDIKRTVRIPSRQSRVVDVIEVMEPNQTLQFANKLGTQNDPDTNRYRAYIKGFRSCSIKPNTLSDVSPSGKYIFHIGIYADRVKPKIVKLSIKYTGDWGTQGIQGMRKKHLKVRLV